MQPSNAFQARRIKNAWLVEAASVMEMSVRRSVTTYGIVAIVIASALIGISMALVPNITTSSQTTSTGVKAPTLSIPLLLTDPPIVPAGTQWVNMTFDGAQIGVVLNDSALQWINVKASGTVDLLDLINVSKTIGLAQVPQGSTVDQIRFDIVSVQIDVNNSVYNVTAVSNTLLVPVARGASVQQLSAVLLDLTSHIVEIYTGNASAPVFVLIPNAVAVVRPSSSQYASQTQVGALFNLTSDERQQLDRARGTASVLASFSVSGNMTTLKVAIENTGNVSVALQAVSLYGQFNLSSSQSTQCQTNSDSNVSTTRNSDNLPMQGQDETTHTETTNATTTTQTTLNGDSDSGNATTSQSVTLTTSDSSYTSQETDYHNSTAGTTESTITQSSTSNRETENGFGCSSNSEFDTSHSMVFVPNGTSLVPLTGEDARSGGQVVIPPNSTETFTFSGVVTGTGGDNSLQFLSLYPIAGNSYQLKVELSNDASISTTVIAS